MQKKVEIKANIYCKKIYMIEKNADKNWRIQY